METSGLLRQLLSLLLLSLISITLTSCATVLRIDGPYEGKVIDSATKQPIEGAVVHGTWVKRHLGGGSDYYNSYEMLTDKNGEFRIPGQGLLVLSEIEELHFTLFKAGYEQITFYWHSKSKEGKWPNNIIVWNGDKATFNLRKMSMSERRERHIDFPLSSPASKEKLLRIESNKEMVEIGRPSTSLLPVE